MKMIEIPGSAGFVHPRDPGFQLIRMSGVDHSDYPGPDGIDLFDLFVLGHYQHFFDLP